MTGKRIGYIRVSTKEQNPDRQIENVELDKRFIEYASAKTKERPELKAMLDYAREDDIIIIHSMDRFARNLKDLKFLVDGLVNRGIQVRFIKENLTFTKENSAMSTLMLHLMGAFAEFEHAFIVERIKEGVAIAKRLGRYKGGKSKLSDEMKEKILLELQSRKTKTKIAQDLGISRESLYRYMGLLNLK